MCFGPESEQPCTEGENTLATSIRRPRLGEKVWTEHGDGKVIEVKSFEVAARLFPNNAWMQAYWNAIEPMLQTPWNVFTYLVEFEDGSLAAFNYFDQPVSVPN